MPTPSITLVPGVDQPVTTTVPFEWRSEATVAANPAYPSNIIAASGNYLRSDYRTARLVSISYSLDSGLSWNESALPLLLGVPAAEADLCNPILDVGADGAAYLFVQGSVGRWV